MSYIVWVYTVDKTPYVVTLNNSNNSNGNTSNKSNNSNDSNNSNNSNNINRRLVTLAEHTSDHGRQTNSSTEEKGEQV